MTGGRRNWRERTKERVWGGGRVLWKRLDRVGGGGERRGGELRPGQGGCPGSDPARGGAPRPTRPPPGPGPLPGPAPAAWVPPSSDLVLAAPEAAQPPLPPLPGEGPGHPGPGLDGQPPPGVRPRALSLTASPCSARSLPPAGALPSAPSLALSSPHLPRVLLPALGPCSPPLLSPTRRVPARPSASSRLSCVC